MKILGPRAARKEDEPKGITESVVNSWRRWPIDRRVVCEIGDYRRVISIRRRLVGSIGHSLQLPRVPRGLIPSAERELPRLEWSQEINRSKEKRPRLAANCPAAARLPSRSGFDRSPMRTPRYQWNRFADTFLIPTLRACLRNLEILPWGARN